MTGPDQNARALVDTNVVVYAYDPADPAKHQRAQELLRELSDSGRLVYSVQVLNEFCSVTMRPSRPAPLLPERIVEVIRNLSATGEVLPLTSTMTTLALEGMARHSLSFWDALIWAAAVENHVLLIYSEDFQDGRLIEGVQIRNPFSLRA